VTACIIADKSARRIVELHIESFQENLYFYCNNEKKF